MIVLRQHVLRQQRTLRRAVLLLFSLAALPLWAQMKVVKVEPPNWWVGLQPSNTMLLITGEGLAGARVSTSYPGTSVARSKASANGHYLFVWLQVSSTAKPGTVPLVITTPAGTATQQFPLQARAALAGKFQGLTPDDVIYLIMPDRFADGDPSNDEPAPDLHTFDRSKPRAWHGGDLKGIRDHLQYLHDLGVTAVWMTPFWKNDWRADDFSYHGYHATDFYRVDEHLGTLSDLQALTAEAHRLGIKVVLDYVVNHTGPHHPWAKDPPQPDWLHGTPEKHANAEYHFNGIVDPHAPQREWINVLNGWFANKLPDLNPNNPQLAQYLLQNAEWWMESVGLDAYRLDTFPYSSRKFWSGWHDGIFRAYPHTTSVGEVWDGDTAITSFFAGGRKQWDGIDTHLSTVFDFPLEFALRDVILKNAPVERIVNVLMRDALYPHPDTLVTFFGNHDVSRFMSEPGASSQKLESAVDLLLTLRGIPQLYYGDEIGMDGANDPDNRHDFPGGFPGDSRSAFTAQGRTPEEQEIFAHFQSMLRFRHEHSALRRGKLTHVAWDKNYYAFLRDDGHERLLVVFNNAVESQSLNIPLAETPLATAAKASPLLNATPATVENQVLHCSVPGNTVSVFKME
jgi:glycosidase